MRGKDINKLPYCRKKPSTVAAAAILVVIRQGDFKISEAGMFP
jgi:hypothetical protein